MDIVILDSALKHGIKENIFFCLEKVLRGIFKKRFCFEKNASTILILNAILLALLFSCKIVPKSCSNNEKEIIFTQEEILKQVPSTINISDDLEAQRKILLAFANAYPEKINSIEWLNNDWTMLLCGRRFFYANGRFLPEELHKKWEEYLPYDFYSYPWTGTARERKLAIKYPVYSVGSSFLFDALYNSHSENDSWNLQEKYSFLGVKTLIHPDIKPILDRITEKILNAAKHDLSIKEWISNLRTGIPTGWSWRSIINTNHRSIHSYGIAIDLLPVDLNGRLTYWQWGFTDIVDSNTYYIPPETVISIFEDHGFIWGGKWDIIDTMHFEYRPEILFLNNYNIHQK
jgi:hypothetical protein